MTYQLSTQYPAKRAFITGAASGLGQALAEELSRHAWSLGLADVDEESLNQVAQTCQALGGRIHTYSLDVSQMDAYQFVAQAFLEQYQGIDLLINNAGVGDGGEVGEYSLENWHWLLGINQMGVLYGCHYFIPVMKQQRSGYIINIASAAAISSAPGMGPYNMSKAAVLSLSETLYGELQAFQVGVSCVMPSFFKTNIMQSSRGGEDVKKMGQHMIDTSNMSAQAVAQEVLQKAGKKQLYLRVTREGKMAWWFKRLAPLRFLKFVANKVNKGRAQVVGEVTKQNVIT